MRFVLLYNKKIGFATASGANAPWRCCASHILRFLCAKQTKMEPLVGDKLYFMGAVAPKCNSSWLLFYDAELFLDVIFDI